MNKQKIVSIRVDRIDEMVLVKLVKSMRVSSGEIFRRALYQFAESNGIENPLHIRRAIEDAELEKKYEFDKSYH